MQLQQPLLYSFRRCPYAIRARMALCWCEIKVYIIEVALKNKPQALYNISPKASVPVLQLPNAQIIDESLDIMMWALQQPSATGSPPLISAESVSAKGLIEHNDTYFKYWLDRYKYHERYPEQSRQVYQQHVLQTLQALNQQLVGQFFLLSDSPESPSLVDLALFPFIRQCAAVDRDWFDNQPLECLQRWLEFWLNHPVFHQVMAKNQS